MNAIDTLVCPRCKLGLDTDRDGDCVVCWRLPDAQARLIGGMADRIEVLQAENVHLREQRDRAIANTEAALKILRSAGGAE